MPSRQHIVIASCAAAVLAGLAFLYEMAGAPVHAPPASLAPFRGESAAAPLPGAPFVDAEGHALSPAVFRGRYVLLNLWAPWCAPCLRELPALAALSRAAPGLRVVAIDVGRDPNANDAGAFLSVNGAAGLPVYLDTHAALMRAFHTYGLPLTVLIDPNGKEVARALGAAPWDSKDSISYFRGLTAHAAS